jgi:hypothetical protein
MAPSENASTLRGYRPATVLGVVGCVLALGAVVGIVVLSLRIRLLHDEFASYRTQADQRITRQAANAEAERAELAQLALRLGDTEKQAKMATSALRSRSITAEQRAAIVGSLRGVKGESVEVDAQNTDYEITAFAEEVSATLRAAGVVARTTLEMGISSQGLSMVVKDAKRVPATAGRIQHAFQAAGLPMKVVADESLPPTAFLIRVGSKPDL